jgi:hypothetical protein
VAVAFAARAFTIMLPILLLAVTAAALAQSSSDRVFAPTPFAMHGSAPAPSLPNDTPEKARVPRWVFFDFRSGIKTVEFADGSVHEDLFDPDPVAQMALSTLPSAAPQDAMVTGSVSSGSR